MKSLVLLCGLLTLTACSTTTGPTTRKCETFYNITGGDFETVSGRVMTDCHPPFRNPRCGPASGCV